MKFKRLLDPPVYMSDQVGDKSGWHGEVLIAEEFRRLCGVSQKHSDAQARADAEEHVMETSEGKVGAALFSSIY